MERIKIIVIGQIEMIYAAYGIDGLKFIHEYLDAHHPGTGIPGGNGPRDLRPPSVKANQQMRLLDYIRNAGRDVHRSELEANLNYTNPDHLSYDLAQLRQRGELRMPKRGYYRPGKRYDS